MKIVSINVCINSFLSRQVIKEGISPPTFRNVSLFRDDPVVFHFIKVLLVLSFINGKKKILFSFVGRSNRRIASLSLYAVNGRMNVLQTVR